jgi:hypothetical protein
LIRLPVRRQRLIRSPEAIERGTLAGADLVDLAALAGRAMLAPFARGFAELGNVVDLAAKRAAAAFPSGNDLHIGERRDWIGSWYSNSSRAMAHRNKRLATSQSTGGRSVSLPMPPINPQPGPRNGFHWSGYDIR